MTSAMTAVARTIAAASLRIVHRARGRYRPFIVRMATHVAAYRRRKAPGSGTIWRHHTAQSGPNRHAERTDQQADGRQAVDRDQERAEPESMPPNHRGQYAGVVRAGNGTDEPNGPPVPGTTAIGSPRLPGMPARSLSIVLPAYNEEARLGPALDELFGYLHRRGPTARDGRPGRPSSRIDPGPRGRRRQHRRHGRPRPCPARGGRRAELRAAHGPARRQGRGGPRRDARRRAATWSCSPTPTWRPRPTSSRSSWRRSTTSTPRYGSRIQADGSRHARLAAGLAAAAGQGVPRARVAVGRGPGPGHAVRVQGLPARRRPRRVRAPAGHEHRVRRRGHLPRPPARLLARRGPDPLGGPSRLADAPGPPPRDRASRGTCSGSRCSTADVKRVTRGATDRACGLTWPYGSVRLTRGAVAAAAAVAIAVVRARRRRRRSPSPGDTLGLRLPRLPRGRRRGSSHGQPAYDTSFQAAGGFGLFYYPPTFIPLVLPFGAARRDDRDLGVDRPARSRRSRRRRGPARVARPYAWLIVLLAGLSWPFLYAIKLGQVGPMLFLAVRGRLALAATAAGARRGGGLGAAIKIQPGLVLVWALLTGRWRRGRRRLGGARRSCASLATSSPGVGVVAGLRRARRPGHRDPITTPHNFTPGRGRVPGRACPEIAASLIQLRVDGRWRRGVRVRRAAAARRASYLVAVVASQLAVADPVGPLRDAAAAPGRVAARARPVVGGR